MEGEPTASVLPDAFYPLAPPLETLMPAKTAGNPLDNEVQEQQADPIALNAYPVTELHTERFEAYLEPAIEAKLIARAKEHDLSFTSLLSAAALKAWYQLISGKRTQRKRCQN